MAPERDNKTGKYQEEFTDNEFLVAVEELRPATTSSVSEEVGCSYDLAYRRLLKLEERGEIEKQDIGGSFVWQVS